MTETVIPPEAQTQPERLRLVEIAVVGGGKEGEPLVQEDGIHHAGEDAGCLNVEDKHVIIVDEMGSYGDRNGGAARAGVRAANELLSSESWDGLTPSEAQARMQQAVEAAHAGILQAKEEDAATPKSAAVFAALKFYTDAEGNQKVAWGSVGDTILAWRRPDGQIVDINYEETIGAAQARRFGTYGYDSASLVTNSIGSKDQPPAFNDRNSGVLDVPEGESLFLAASDGLEQVFRDRQNFQERQGSKSGNLVERFRRVFGDNKVSAQAIADRLLQMTKEAPEDGHHIKVDDCLFYAVKLQVGEADNGSSDINTEPESEGHREVPEAAELNAALMALPERIDPNSKEFAEQMSGLLAEGDTAAAVRLFEASGAAMVDRIRNSATSRSDYNYYSTMLVMMEGAIQVLDQRVGRKHLRRYNKGLEAYNAVASLAQSAAEHWLDSTDIENSFAIGDAMTLQVAAEQGRLSTEQLTRFEALCDTLRAPFLSVLSAQEQERRHYGQKLRLVGGVALGLVNGTKDKLNTFYLRPAIGAQNAMDRLRLGRAMTFLPLAFVAGAAANYVGQKYGVWGGGGGGATTEALPSTHEISAAVPPEAVGQIELGGNHTLHLPEGYVAYDSGHGIEIFHNNQHVANLDASLVADGQLSPADQQALTNQLQSAGIHAELSEIMERGQQHAQFVEVDDRRWFDNNTLASDGNELNADVVRLDDGRIAIDISGMDNISRLGSSTVDPQHTPMHALVTDTNGHTVDLPIHDGRVIADTNSDVGRMLADGTYHKIEIAALDHGTANIVATDFGHGGGELPDNPTVGQGQEATGDFALEVTSDESKPIATTVLNETTPAVNEASTDLASAATAGGTAATGAGLGVLGIGMAQQMREINRRDRRETNERTEEEAAQRREQEVGRRQLIHDLQDYSRTLASEIIGGAEPVSEAIVGMVQHFVDEARQAKVSDAEIQDTLDDVFAAYFPGHLWINGDGAVEVSSAGGSFAEWAHREQMLDALANNLQSFAAGFAGGFDIHQAGAQSHFFTELAQADIHNAREAIRFLGLTPYVDEVNRRGAVSFKVGDSSQGRVGEILERALAHRLSR